MKFILAFIILAFTTASCQTAAKKASDKLQKEQKIITIMTDEKIPNSTLDTITLGTGCFWCTEAIFRELDGVSSAISGYSGGHVDNPTYEEVCDKQTGHAECIQVVYNPSIISLDELLEVFWKVHDPTTLNQQGADIGPQYRSVIFYTNNYQKEKASYYIKALDSSGAYNNPIVTTLEPFTKFYSAESYHQNYYELNSEQGYCKFVIKPKLDKFRKVFKDKLKKQ